MRNESSQPIQPRIMMYSQDGLGLGHMRRTSSIANQTAQVRPDAAILTMADAQLGQFFETSKNHDYLKLPRSARLAPAIGARSACRCRSMMSMPCAAH